MDTNTTRTSIPKLLPWLAHKAGIDEVRAEALWHVAAHHAAIRSGESGTPAHAQAAMEHLLDLLADESRREDAASFGLRRWARLNAAFWQTPVALYDAVALNAACNWRRLDRTIRPC